MFLGTFSGRRSRSESDVESSPKRPKAQSLDNKALKDIANSFLTSDESLLPEELTRESSSERKRVDQKAQLIQVLWLAKAKIITQLHTMAEQRERIDQLEAKDREHRTERLEMASRISVLESNYKKKQSPPKTQPPTQSQPPQPPRGPQPKMGTQQSLKGHDDATNQSILDGTNMSIIKDDRCIVEAKKVKTRSPPSLLNFQMNPRPDNFHFYGRYPSRRGYKNPIRGNFVSRYDDNLNPLYGRGYAVSGRGGRRGYLSSPSQRRPFPRGYMGGPLTEDLEMPMEPQDIVPVTISQSSAIASASAVMTSTASIPLPPSEPPMQSSQSVPETPKAKPKTRKRFSRFKKEDPQRSDTTEPQSSDPASYERMNSEEVDIEINTSGDDEEFIEKREKE